MLPILISEAAPIGEILGILAVKFVLGMIYGFIIDFVIRLKNKNRAEEERIIDLCEKEHCHCEKSLIKSAIKHTVSILIYIFILTLIVKPLVETRVQNILIMDQKFSNCLVFLLNDIMEKCFKYGLIATIIGLCLILISSLNFFAKTIEDKND